MSIPRRGRPLTPASVISEQEQEPVGICAPVPVGLPDVAPSVAAAVEAWLCGRSVGSASVRGDVLTVVSWPDCQKAVWRL
jgi:hypothetical protein